MAGRAGDGARTSLMRAPGAADRHASPEMSTQLADAAAEGYTAAFPDAELVTFTVADVSFLFDHTTYPTRAPRTVAAWPHSRARSRTGTGPGRPAFPYAKPMPTLATTGAI